MKGRKVDLRAIIPLEKNRKHSGDRVKRHMHEKEVLVTGWEENQCVEEEMT